MAKQKAVKRRRAGGGRKPQGNFSRLRSVMSFRISAEMQNELMKAAKESDRSVTQELLGRLKRSFEEDRKNHRDPATRALCFLFSELAEYVHHGTPDWRSDPFLFRAFKIGVTKLLDALEPAGKIATPPLLKIMFEQFSKDDPMHEREFFRKERERLVRIMKSPEALAEFASEGTLAAFFRTDPVYKHLEESREALDAMPELPGIGSKLLQYQENIFYGNQQAREALHLKPRGGKS